MKILEEFARFTLVGGSCFALNLAILWLGTSQLGLPYLLSAMGSFVAACILGYLFNHSFTFTARTRGHRPSTTAFARYVGVACISLVLSLLLMYTFVAYLHLNYLVANVAAGTALLGANFISHKLWSFRRRAA